MTHVVKPAFAHSRGPRRAKIAFVGEAWGEEEAKLGLPFVGWSGQELDRMINEGGLDRSQLFFTNVIAAQPPGNKFDYFLVPKKDASPESISLGLVDTGKYLHDQYLGELVRLEEELNETRPNLVVALGNKACWALLGQTKISAIRGTCHQSRLGLRRRADWKVLPTYHPAYILRDWSKRTIVVADLMKAVRESKFPDVRRPQRWVIVSPTLEEIDAWIEKYALQARWLAVDIETASRQITCIGFGASRERAISIPFVDRRKPGWNFWSSLEDELAAWDRVARLLAMPIPKIFQNGMYDMQYLWSMGLTVAMPTHDTMLLHHSLLPEMPKGLGFLGSIYTDEPAWKLMRHDETEKKDE